ncbi:MAG: recombination mediator RecR [Synergistaceae bacterium]|nr:recombination mediator RecR [Synergistaceae bacterium]
MVLPDSIGSLISIWSKLPGVGEKTARRMVFYLLRQNKDMIKNFANALLALAENVQHCEICGAISDMHVCSICRDTMRDKKTICIVETEEDCVALEQAGVYNGLYHILGGRYSPLNNETIPIQSLERLAQRIANSDVEEIIIATSPRLEGDLTAFALKDTLKNFPIKISRLSYGLPVGGSIGYADRVTLHIALDSRQEME